MFLTEGRWTSESLPSALAAGLSQLLAVRTGVNHLTGVGLRPHRRAAAVSLLRLKGAMHCGAVAAAPEGGGGNREVDRKGEGEEKNVRVGKNPGRAEG